MSDKKITLNELGYSQKQEEELIKIVKSKDDSVYISGHTESIECKYNKRLYDSIVETEKCIKGD